MRAIGILLVLILAACGVGQALGGSSVPSVAPPETSAQASTTLPPTTSVPASTTTTLPPTTTLPGDLGRVVALFGEWVESLADGDLERAWDLLTPESQRRIGGYERLAALRTDFAEGWGAWAWAEDLEYSLDHGEDGHA